MVNIFPLYVDYHLTVPLSFTCALNSLPGLKNGSFFGFTKDFSPVLGLRPSYDLYFLMVKLPNPLISIDSPQTNADVIVSMIVPIIAFA